ncbi:hypothetical protein EYC80_005514 [Monilinia laxa]|uniref:F-box domain-containing protein n=1 Tax=Monilinia laxa TaxID=61186 RepID=A0A5N6KE98_MONLA|nr:hypothetical protein EYC80_005514 [Monilinia laxa]
MSDFLTSRAMSPILASLCTKLPEFQPDNHSRFLKMPAELRLMFYKHLFDGTRVTFGYRRVGDEYRKVLPSRNALAILRVCRRTQKEADDLWISRILFSFEDNMTLLDKLSLLPIETLGQIKHLRTRMLGHEPFLLQGDFGDELAYKFLLLPGLRLDTLTIVSGFCCSYSTSGHIKEFLKTSFPCKELHQVTPGSPFHSNSKPNTSRTPKYLAANILAWESDLAGRTDTSAQVTISITQSSETGDERTGTVYKDSARQLLAETAISQGVIGQEKLTSLGMELEPSAETLVIFKPSFTTATAPSIVPVADEETELEIPDSEDEEDIPRVWRGDLRDEYVQNTEIDMEDMTTGKTFPWPKEINAEHTIFDEYSNINEMFWHTPTSY